MSNVLPDFLSRLLKSSTASSGATSVLLAVPTMGSPLTLWPGVFDDGPVEVSRVADWVPPPRSALGGSEESDDVDIDFTYLLSTFQA